MRYQYVVILKKSSERLTDALSVLLCLVSAICFSISGISGFHTAHLAGRTGAGSYPGAPTSAYADMGAALILLIGISINLVVRRRSPTPVRYRYWLILAAVGWIGLTSFPWMGAIFFLLAFLEYQTKRPLEIGFHHDRIVINTLIKQRFDWSDFDNIILKDGLLTLDFKNDRLMQKEVADDEDEDDADEEEFNAFCRSRFMEIRRSGISP